MVASSSQAEASLRRAAILLNNLDIDSRRRLLAQFSPSEANQLRAAAASLADVDPLEVRRVVSAFLGKVKVSSAPSRIIPAKNGDPMGAVGTAPMPPRGSDPSVIKSSDARREPSGSEPGVLHASQESATKQRLQFLSNVSDETLLMVLRDEHPQAIAVVLGALPAPQAARLLKYLAPEQRLQALRRLGRLDEIPGEILEEIANHLRKTVGEIEPTLAREGHRTLVSIFAALEPSERASLVTTLEYTDTVVSRALQVANNVPNSAGETKHSLQDNDVIQSNLSDERRSGLRLLPDSQDVSDQVTEASGQNGVHPTLDARRSVGNGNSGPASGQLPNEVLSIRNMSEDSQTAPLSIDSEIVDQLLGTLSAKQLQIALAQLSGHEAILAVTGLEPKIAKRLYRSLPRRRVKEIEQRIHSLGQIEMRSIELAKESVLRVALASHWVQLPASQTTMGVSAAAPFRRAA